MPNQTVNFNLPYPSGSDAPCDFAEQWCDFTDAINVVMARFQAGIDRAVPVVPAAVVRSTIVRSVFDTNDIPFNEVVIDTAGMTDLDADPFQVTVTRPGRYTVGAYLEKGTAAAGNSVLNVSADGFALWNILDTGAVLTYSAPAYNPVATISAGTKISLSFLNNVVAAQNIDVAWLSVIWHSDTEAPL